MHDALAVPRAPRRAMPAILAPCARRRVRRPFSRKVIDDWEGACRGVPQPR